jgi:SET domain-containing protein
VIADIEARGAGRKGQGVFARRAFRKGEFIFQRRHGRVVPNARISSLSAEERRHLCELDFARSAVLVGPGAFLNHSCDPNAMRSGVKVFAWRAVRRGEEITIDYRLNAFGGQRTTCLCGARNCTGTVVNSYFALSPARQRAYMRYAPAFIRREHRRRSATVSLRSR